MPGSVARNIQLNVVGDTSHATAALSKVAAHGEAQAGKLHGAFQGATSGIAGMFGPIGGEIEKIGGALERVGSKGGTGIKGALLGITGGLAAVAVGMGVEAVKAADDYEKAHVQLEQAIRNTGTTFEAHKKQIETLDSSMHKFGYTSEQTEGALSHFVTGTQDVEKSVRLMGLAADIAKARNIDLTSATDLVTKASEGNLRALKAMGIDLPIHAANSLKLEAAQAAVAKAQEAVNAAQAKGQQTAAQHNSQIKAQEQATIALQSAEEKVRMDRAKGVPAFQLKIDLERLTLAQQAMTAAQTQALPAHQQLEKAKATLTAAEQKLKDEQSAGTEVIDALTQRFGGQASAAAETFGGKIATAKASYHDLMKDLGMKIEPVAVDVLDWFTNTAVPFAIESMKHFRESWDGLANHFGDTKLGDFLEKNGFQGAIDKGIQKLKDIGGGFQDFLHTLGIGGQDKGAAGGKSSVNNIAGWPTKGRSNTQQDRWWDIPGAIHDWAADGNFNWSDLAPNINKPRFGAGPDMAPNANPANRGTTGNAINVNVQTNADPNAIAGAIAYSQSARGL